MIDHDRAARRYFQIRDVEASISLVEKSIADVQTEIDDAEGRLHELRAQKTALGKEMREAARDEGKLPLIDLMADTDVAGATKQ